MSQYSTSIFSEPPAITCDNCASPIPPHAPCYWGQTNRTLCEECWSSEPVAAIYQRFGEVVALCAVVAVALLIFAWVYHGYASSPDDRIDARPTPTEMSPGR